MQAAAQQWVGGTCTAFERCVEGSLAINKRDVVLLSGKPSVVGAVLAFTVAQVQSSKQASCLNTQTLTLGVGLSR